MATCNTLKKFGEDWTCGSEDMRADYVITVIQTRSIVTILRCPTGSGVTSNKMPVKVNRHEPTLSAISVGRQCRLSAVTVARQPT